VTAGLETPQPPAASPRAERGRNTLPLQRLILLGFRARVEGGSNEPGLGLAAAQQPVILSSARHRWSSELFALGERGGYLNPDQLFCLSEPLPSCSTPLPAAFNPRKNEHVLCRGVLHPSHGAPTGWLGLLPSSPAKPLPAGP